MSKINKYIISTLFVAFNVCIILMPDEAFSGAKDGLLLWFNRVLPSLVPFAVGINVLTGLGVTERVGTVRAPVMKPLFNLPGAAGVAVLTGMTSGYPMGAKVTADLREKGLLNQDEAQRLAGFSNNAGPLFVVSVCGTAVFGSAELGYGLLYAHLASAMMLGIGMGVLSRMRRRRLRNAASRDDVYTSASPLAVSLPAASPLVTSPLTASSLTVNRNCPPHDVKHKLTFGRVLGGAVKNTMEAVVLVGGLIIFFCAASRILAALGILNGIASGLLEITSGVNALMAADSLSVNAKLILTAGVISFGGLSVHAQAAHFLSGAGISPARYLLCKLIHGLLASAIVSLQIFCDMI
jgi:sporulation integral membrane protein YlbJ